MICLIYELLFKYQCLLMICLISVMLANFSNAMSVHSLHHQAFSGPCLLDCILLDLTEVDVFSARKVPLEGDNFKIVRQVWRTSQTSQLHVSLCMFSR